MATPLYKRLKQNGTTFYAFPGAAEDISAAYQNQNYRMYFSKYLLLNFPKQNLSSGTNSNTIYWDFEDTTGNGFGFKRSAFSTPPTDYQDALVESLRNYVANYEVTMKESRTNDREFYYDNRVPSTPTEKIFWKWCKKLNLIDFETALAGDEYFNNLPEFERNNLTDDEYFPEVLWKEREVIDWDTVEFYESGRPGRSGKLEFEVQGTTNFRVGDTIVFSNLESLTLLNDIRVQVLELIAPTATEGQKIVVDYTYTSTTVTEPNGKVKLVYERLVQYIGEVNGISNVQNANRAYTEVYAHIPDHTGRTPDILFRTVVDVNYKPNMVFPILPSQYQPEIKGAELFTSPIVSSPQNYPGNYFGQFDTEDFTYETQTGDSVRRSGDYYGISGDINNSSVDGSLIDGIIIDFDPAHYVKMNIGGREITNFDQFNALMVNNLPPQDFDFNAILWYYTVEDLAGNITNNLYGISFVDNPDNNPVPSEVGLKVPTFRKLATTDDQDGTSYAFSLNLNFNIINENPQDTYNPEAINSLFSFNLFNEAMRRLGNVNESFVEIVASQGVLEEEIMNMKQLLYSQTDFAVINSRIANLESLLRLYSTNQIIDSESIEVSLDETFRPARLVLNNIDPSYHSVYEISTSNLYNLNGLIPALITVPRNKNFFVKVQNNDTTIFNLPNDDKLTIIFDRDLDYKQSVKIKIDANLTATQNKRLDIMINYGLGANTAPVETRLVETIDLPIFFNSSTSVLNSAYNWSKIDFTINLDQPIKLNQGSILEVPLNQSTILVNNSFKVGDTLQLNNFTIGTMSQLNFSGQYTINSISSTNPIIYLDVSNNQTMVNYGASSSNPFGGSLPLVFNATASTYLLSNIPYFSLNKGTTLVITRILETDESDITNRYTIERY